MCIIWLSTIQVMYFNGIYNKVFSLTAKAHCLRYKDMNQNPLLTGVTVSKWQQPVESIEARQDRGILVESVDQQMRCISNRGTSMEHSTDRPNALPHNKIWYSRRTQQAETQSFSHKYFVPKIKISSIPQSTVNRPNSRSVDSLSLTVEY